MKIVYLTEEIKQAQYFKTAIKKNRFLSMEFNLYNII